MCVGRIRDDAAGRAAYRARTSVAQRTARWPITRLLRGASLTRTIIALNITIVVAMYLTGKPTGHQTLLRFGAMQSPLPRSEWWRLITAMFVHIGIFHLLVNTWALMLFGPGLEERYGRGRFIATYLVSGMLGSAFSLAFGGGGGRIAAGASGAIFGIMGAWLAFFVRHRNVPSLRGQLRSVLFLIAINLYFGAATRGIDNFAHIGGLVAGVFIGSALEWSARAGRGARSASWLGALAGSLLLAAILAAPHMV